MSNSIPVETPVAVLVTSNPSSWSKEAVIAIIAIFVGIIVPCISYRYWKAAAKRVLVRCVRWIWSRRPENRDPVIQPRFYPSPYDVALEEVSEWRELGPVRSRPRNETDIEAGSSISFSG